MKKPRLRELRGGDRFVKNGTKYQVVFVGKHPITRRKRYICHDYSGNGRTFTGDVTVKPIITYRQSSAIVFDNIPKYTMIVN